jgi:hypothetical protein
MLAILSGNSQPATRHGIPVPPPSHHLVALWSDRRVAWHPQRRLGLPRLPTPTLRRDPVDAPVAQSRRGLFSEHLRELLGVVGLESDEDIGLHQIDVLVRFARRPRLVLGP